MTTGHEWNGITELNTPVPRPIYVFLAAAALFAVVYWVLMPAWPTGTGYTKGLLGFDQRTAVEQSLRQATLDRAVWTKKIAAESFATIAADPALMAIVRQTGRALFGDNCAACHGREARGNSGFPNLTTASWLWGGSPEAIAETIRVGINSSHPESRSSQMPAFGRDGVLPRGDIENVVAYIKSLSKPDSARGQEAAVAAGRKVFATTCAACHGEQATGNAEVGVPNLTDKFWIYGGAPEKIFETVWGGRQGHMPTWEGRLSPTDRKILALYLLDLRRAGQ
jgi:cytochrome c oxidase cbb3-type subunit 3